jgi:hypothetical protein
VLRKKASFAYLEVGAGELQLPLGSALRGCHQHARGVSHGCDAGAGVPPRPVGPPVGGCLHSPAISRARRQPVLEPAQEEGLLSGLGSKGCVKECTILC